MVTTRRSARKASIGSRDRFSRENQPLNPSHQHETKHKQTMRSFATMLNTVEAVAKLKKGNLKGRSMRQPNLDNSESESEHEQETSLGEEDSTLEPTDATNDEDTGSSPSMDIGDADDVNAGVSSGGESDGNGVDGDIDQNNSAEGSDLDTFSNNSEDADGEEGLDTFSQANDASKDVDRFGEENNDDDAPLLQLLIEYFAELFHFMLESVGLSGDVENQSPPAKQPASSSFDLWLMVVGVLCCLVVAVVQFAPPNVNADDGAPVFSLEEEQEMISMVISETMREYERSLFKVAEEERDRIELHKKHALANLASNRRRQGNLQDLLDLVDKIEKINTPTLVESATGEESDELALGPLRQEMERLIQETGAELGKHAKWRASLPETETIGEQALLAQQRLLELDQRMELEQAEVDVISKRLAEKQTQLVDMERTLEQLVNETTSTQEQGQTLVRELRDAERRFNEQAMGAVQEVEACAAASNDGQQGCVSRRQVDELVDSAVERFHADTIGKSDFALSSLGASIEIGEDYTSHPYRPVGTSMIQHVQEYLYPFSRPSDAVIDGDTTIGNCWACALPDCAVTVRLVRPIVPKAFTLDHISPDIAHDIRSAPKNVKVWGVVSPEEEGNRGAPKRNLLATYQYSIEPTAHPVQTFESHEHPGQVYDLIQLQVLSNYGHPDYTCLYRFRVHDE